MARWAAAVEELSRLISLLRAEKWGFDENENMSAGGSRFSLHFAGGERGLADGRRRHRHLSGAAGLGGEIRRSTSGDQVNYQAIGSGGGIKQIEAKTVDFANSDKPLMHDELVKNQSGAVPAGGDFHRADHRSARHRRRPDGAGRQ